MKIRTTSQGLPLTLKKLAPSAGLPESWLPIRRASSVLGTFCMGLLVYAAKESE